MCVCVYVCICGRVQVNTSVSRGQRHVRVPGAGVMVILSWLTRLLGLERQYVLLVRSRLSASPLFMGREVYCAQFQSLIWG